MIAVRRFEKSRSYRVLAPFVPIAVATLLALVCTMAIGRSPDVAPLATAYGIYRVGPEHLIGIDRFASDWGEDVVLFSDYQSGIVRRLFPAPDGEFVMGPGFNDKTPVELKIRFLSDGQHQTTSLALEPMNAAAEIAQRIPLVEEEVAFSDGNVRLAGTLFLPAGKGPHPAIVLLHGSGPLTRFSFGPYPHFFASLGMAVLVYDKRGTGASSGTLFDISTHAPIGEPASFYPDELANDALAAIKYLQGRKEIDPKQIGVWGSSEGGTLTTQVAARSKDVAFAIDSSGFMGPVWETILYQIEATRRAAGDTEEDIDEAIAFNKLALRVARTGEDYDLFLRRRHEAIAAKKPWINAKKPDPSLEQVRWDWVHTWSFSPLPALGKVTCPILAVYGEMDTSTSARNAVENMQRVLSEAGHKDFTLRIFPNAGHSLAEMPSGSRMAPGVFETLRSWLVRRVHGVT